MNVSNKNKANMSRTRNCCDIKRFNCGYRHNRNLIWNTQNRKMGNLIAKCVQFTLLVIMLNNSVSVAAVSLARTKRTTVDTSYNNHDIAHSIPNENNNNRTWRLITRAEWEARRPMAVENFTGPAPYVILHHSYQPGVCLREDTCKVSMRSMQNFHMDSHGWTDIGYTYAIGGDGNVYEGRGYNVVGAHAPNYNSRSIGLLLIGNFDVDLPPPQMLDVAKDFIKHSVEIGQLRKDYILHGHRQVRATECPGNALYNEITKWAHWAEATQSL